MTTIKQNITKLFITMLVLIAFTSGVNAAEKPLAPITDNPVSGVSQPVNNSPFNMTEKPVQNQQQNPITGKQSVNNANAPQPFSQSLINNPENVLGLAYNSKELERSAQFIAKNDFASAKDIVEPLTQWLTELTEYHMALYQKLNSVETAKMSSQVEKKLALSFGQLRDTAYYQLGIIYIAEKQPKKAVKYFVNIVKSQPRTELGVKAYENLQLIGFTEKVKLVD